MSKSSQGWSPLISVQWSRLVLDHPEILLLRLKIVIHQELPQGLSTDILKRIQVVYEEHIGTLDRLVLPIGKIYPMVELDVTGPRLGQVGAGKGKHEARLSVQNVGTTCKFDVQSRYPRYLWDL